MLLLAWGAALLLATGSSAMGRRAAGPIAHRCRSTAVVMEVRLASSRQAICGRRHDQWQPVEFSSRHRRDASRQFQPMWRSAWVCRLKRAAIIISTANGRATAHRTRRSVCSWAISSLTDVDALIAPGMGGDDVLLGMSALETTRIYPARRHLCCASQLLQQPILQQPTLQ